MSLFCVGRIAKLYVRSEKEAIRDTKGNLITPAQRRLFVEFQHGGSIPDYAMQKASEKLSFTGQPENGDPLADLTWFDSNIAAAENNWTAEELAVVEAKLRERDGDGFIIVEQPVVEPPFPNWVKQTSVHGQRKIEHVVADALRFVAEMGLDVNQIAAFEHQQNRRESAAIVEALTATPPEAEPEKLVAA